MTILNVSIKHGGYETGKALIHNISFSISSGKILGMIGSNGAGKSTTIKGMMGLLPFMEGESDIAEGVSYSYIPERPVYYDELTLWEHIDFVGSAENIPQPVYKNRGEELVKEIPAYGVCSSVSINLFKRDAAKGDDCPCASYKAGPIDH